MESSLPIAVFDSGVGGLAVFQTLSQMLPCESFVYLADNKRVPYGNLSPKTVVRYTLEAISFLAKEKVKLVVLGCHTASARCLYGENAAYFQRNIKVPVIGMVQGALRKVREFSTFRKIAVIGTLSTIESNVYKQLLLMQNPYLEVNSIACPKLASMIELGLFSHPDTESLVREYLKPLQNERVDAVLLGCTHYSLIANLIQEVIGKDVTLIDSSDKTAEEVSEYLKEKKLLNDSLKPYYRFYATAYPEMFAKSASSFLQKSKHEFLIAHHEICLS